MNSTDSDSNIKFTIAQKEDLDHLEEIRQKAFQPIFDSFRNILGDTIYEFAQLPEDLAQKDLLQALTALGSSDCAAVILNPNVINTFVMAPVSDRCTSFEQLGKVRPFVIQSAVLPIYAQLCVNDTQIWRNDGKHFLLRVTVTDTFSPQLFNLKI